MIGKKCNSISIYIIKNMSLLENTELSSILFVTNQSETNLITRVLDLIFITTIF